MDFFKPASRYGKGVPAVRWRISAQSALPRSVVNTFSFTGPRCPSVSTQVSIDRSIRVLVQFVLVCLFSRSTPFYNSLNNSPLLLFANSFFDPFQALFNRQKSLSILIHTNSIFQPIIHTSFILFNCNSS